MKGFLGAEASLFSAGALCFSGMRALGCSAGATSANPNGEAASAAGAVEAGAAAGVADSAAEKGLEAFDAPRLANGFAGASPFELDGFEKMLLP